MANRTIRERWVSIPGHRNYEASDRGRVRSLDRWVRLRHRSGTMYWRLQKGRILSPADSHGYYVVNVGPAPLRTARVHCLVLRAFKGPRPKGLEARHRNGVKTDNRLSNLKYGTRLDNMRDRELHGKTPKGQRHGRRKLSSKDVRAIRRSSSSTIALAERYGVTYWCIYQLLSGRTWGSLP